MVEIVPVNVTYEPFSHEPEYIEANRGFVCRRSLANVQRFLDLACGTGTVSQLLLEQSPSAHLIGMDYDPVQIQLSADRFTKLGYEVRLDAQPTDDWANDKPVLVFQTGSAQELPFADASFDCVTIANAIHLIPDKMALLRSVCRVLKPGGVFGFNTAFYSGSMPEGTDRLYMDWLRRATEYIASKSAERKAQGQEPIRRTRGTSAHKAFANRWYSGGEWSDMLREAAFGAVDTHERRVDLSERSFTNVGAYGGMAEVLLSGFPVEIASEALQAAAGPAMHAAGATVVPRMYLEVWAEKP